jgi:hypothetical protein
MNSATGTLPHIRVSTGKNGRETSELEDLRLAKVRSRVRARFDQRPFFMSVKRTTRTDHPTLTVCNNRIKFAELIAETVR